MFDMCVWWRVRVRERGGQDSCCGMQGLENVVLDAFCVCVCVCVCVQAQYASTPTRVCACVLACAVVGRKRVCSALGLGLFQTSNPGMHT